MKKQFTAATLKRAEWLVALVLIGFAGLMAAAAAFTGVEQVWQYINKIDGQLLAILISLSAINWLTRGYRWHLFSNKLGIAVPSGRLWLYYLAGYALVPTPGKIGTAVRLWLIKRGHGVPINRSAPMMFMDQLTDFIAMFILTAIGIGMFVQHWAYFVIFAVLLAAVFALIFQPQLLRKLIKFGYWLTGCRFKRLFAGLLKMLKHTRALFSPKLLLQSTALSTVAGIAVCFAFWLILQRFGADISLLAATAIFCFSVIFGGLSLMPGGLGSAEASIFAMLLVAGTDPQLAIAATAIIRLVTLWLSVLLGFVMLPIALRTVK